MNKRWVIIGALILLFVAVLAWLFIESQKPLPGQKQADLGRNHVPIGEKVNYNSNPPTSGAHYEDWIRAGVYETAKEDGYLVHSLEHGYIIMSYSCAKRVGWIPQTLAHGIEEEKASSSTEATAAATLSAEFRSEDCHKLIDQLISLYEKKGKKKLIVIPRPNMDSRIALTAWTYIDKFDPSTSSGLSVSETERIERFIDAHLNQGPEKTME